MRRSDIGQNPHVSATKLAAKEARPVSKEWLSRQAAYSANGICEAKLFNVYRHWRPWARSAETRLTRFRQSPSGGIAPGGADTIARASLYSSRRIFVVIHSSMIRALITMREQKRASSMAGVGPARSRARASDRTSVIASAFWPAGTFKMAGLKIEVLQDGPVAQPDRAAVS